MNRRELLKAALASVAVWPTRPPLLGAQPPVFAASTRKMLDELAACVLPESLTRSGTDEVADRFVRWLMSYRAGVAMDHGYGQTRQQRTAASPADRYAGELDAFEQRAREQGRTFGTLSLADRRALVETALAEAKVEQLPARAGAQHIAVDLMAFYFRGSDATDRCYRAAIRRYDCRGLGDSTQPPAPLEGGG